MQPSFSQFGQDVYLMERVYPGKRGGYFVELGAVDGREKSNTYLLEKQYGWNGICIEPNEVYQASLKANRGCHISFDLVHELSNVPYHFRLEGELSGTQEDLQSVAHLEGFRSSTPQIRILLSKSLTDILDQFKAPGFIEYLSLDTEGSELPILKGVDWSRYTFGYICVEHNGIQCQRDALREFLQPKGYRWVRENVVDDEYAHFSVKLPS